MSEPSAVAIEFKGRHDHITERMQSHALKKLCKLARYNDRVERIEVVADHAHKNPEVELIAHMRRGAPLVARDRARSFSATIDQLIEKMEKQLKKQKEKLKDHKQGGRRTTRDGGKGKVDKDEETYEDIVRKTLKG